MEDDTITTSPADVADSKKRMTLQDAYGDGDAGRVEAEYAKRLVSRINDHLKKREEPSAVHNGLAYSKAYLYNQRKAINYAPPKDPKDDREVSMGLVHEKIVSFAAVFLKYVFKRRIKAYGDDGKLIPGLGDFYDLAIEFSLRLEQFKKKLALIYWETFTQGNAFVLEEWEVKNLIEIDAYMRTEAGGEPKKVTSDTMDYTYEFLDGLEYKEGEEYQERRAVSRVLDGRMVIFSNEEIEDVQDMPMITIEQVLTRDKAEQMLGSLKRWDAVPKDKLDIDIITGEKITLFNNDRLTSPADQVIFHMTLDKENNRFNLLANGLMLLPSKTPFTLFYPRNNYPLTNVPAERLTGSIRSRSIPAKTKFNADYVDWAMKILALKFEQGAIPAILAKGKYTLTRDIFRAGQVTHGVSSSDYERADPENKGVTAADSAFVAFVKEQLEAATLNPTASGELAADATATEIAITDQNQRDKLAYLLDGIAGGMMDLFMRRAETIESKYTIKQRETDVDGKKISVYQNFTINVAGVNNSVILDDTIGNLDYDHDDARNELHKKAYLDRKEGVATEYYLADPIAIRQGKYTLDMEIHPEKLKETDLQMTQLWNEFTELTTLFGQSVDMQELQKIYLETSGRPSEIFKPADVMRLQQLTAQQTGAAPVDAAPAAGAMQGSAVGAGQRTPAAKKALTGAK